MAIDYVIFSKDPEQFAHDKFTIMIRANFNATTWNITSDNCTIISKKKKIVDQQMYKQYKELKKNLVEYSCTAILEGYGAEIVFRYDEHEYKWEIMNDSCNFKE